MHVTICNNLEVDGTARLCFVFNCVHKEIDNAFSPGDDYSFHESDLQITLRLLSSWFRKHSSFAYVISRIRNTNRPKKKLGNVFQSNCSSHAELLTNLRKIEKRPKIRHKAVMHPALQLSVVRLKITYLSRGRSQRIVSQLQHRQTSDEPISRWNHRYFVIRKI